LNYSGTPVVTISHLLLQQLIQLWRLGRGWYLQPCGEWWEFNSLWSMCTSSPKELSAA